MDLSRRKEEEGAEAEHSSCDGNYQPGCPDPEFGPAAIVLRDCFVGQFMTYETDADCDKHRHQHGKEIHQRRGERVSVLIEKYTNREAQAQRYPADCQVTQLNFTEPHCVIFLM
jgi:hypothetical protein